MNQLIDLKFSVIFAVNLSLSISSYILFICIGSIYIKYLTHKTLANARVYRIGVIKKDNNVSSIAMIKGT